MKASVCLEFDERNRKSGVDCPGGISSEPRFRTLLRRDMLLSAQVRASRCVLSDVSMNVKVPGGAVRTKVRARPSSGELWAATEIATLPLIR